MSRFGSFTVRTECERCGMPLPINGPVRTARCGACQAELGVPASVLGELLVTLDDAHAAMSDGATRSRVWELAEKRFHCSYTRSAPRCGKCSQPLPVDVALDAERELPCETCGVSMGVYPAPEWVKQLSPTSQQVYSTVQSRAMTAGEAPAKVADATAPVVMPCPRCGAALEVVGESERTVKCRFCSTDIFLPDELWSRLHPVRTVHEWFVRFDGETRAEREARYAALHAQKEEGRRRLEEEARKKALEERERGEEEARRAALEARHRTLTWRIGAWVGGHVILTLLGALALLGLFYSSVRPILPVRVTVRVVDTQGAAVSAARVYVDGTAMCDFAPCVVTSKRPGTHTIKVDATYYFPAPDQVVEVLAGTDKTVDFSLTPQPTGLKVAATVVPAILFVDGKEIGPLPREVHDMVMGAHRLRITAGDAYAPYEKTVYVSTSQITDLGTIALVPARVTPRVAISLATPGARVFLQSGSDRRELPSLPITIALDPSHSWTVLGTKTGYSDYSQAVDFSSTSTQRIVVTLQPKAK
jgi:hypothetical protein